MAQSQATSTHLCLDPSIAPCVSGTPSPFLSLCTAISAVSLLTQLPAAGVWPRLRQLQGPYAPLPSIASCNAACFPLCERCLPGISMPREGNRTVEEVLFYHAFWHELFLAEQRCSISAACRICQQTAAKCGGRVPSPTTLPGACAVHRS